ncbi:hypothetical protein CRE_02564 [Caenorhabditis remanei]|uniref:Uncharacterized protein n=2 Tax=Caenorhabditis remanei TaxID=31234 RepID=E3N4U5_CAERE|nr:hypothetical protein CRE_02564 [Caenorhabditis remanei]
MPLRYLLTVLYLFPIHLLIQLRNLNKLHILMSHFQCYQDRASPFVPPVPIVPIPFQETPNPSKTSFTTFRLFCDPTCKRPLATPGYRHPFMIGERCCSKCYTHYFLRKQRNVPYGPFKPCANPSCKRLTEKKALCRFCYKIGLTRVCSWFVEKFKAGRSNFSCSYEVSPLFTFSSIFIHLRYEIKLNNLKVVA